MKLKVIIPRKAKYENAVKGRFLIREGEDRLYFKSKKEIVYINEHFAKTTATPVKLIENTIRFDSENPKSKQ